MQVLLVRTEKIGTADVGVDRSVVDNGVAALHVRKRVLREVEEGVDISIKCKFPVSLLAGILMGCCWKKLPLLLGKVLDVLDHVLVGSVVDKDVDGTHLLEGGVDNLLAFFLLLEIDLEQVALAAVRLDLLLGLLRILLLDFEVGDQAVGALHGEENSNGTANTGVTSSDNSLLALKLAGSLVKLEAAIFGREVLVHRFRALLLALETRRLLMGDGDLETFLLLVIVLPCSYE